MIDLDFVFWKDYFVLSSVVCVVQPEDIVFLVIEVIVVTFIHKTMCEVVYPTSRAVDLGVDEAEEAEEERNVFLNPVARPIVRLSKSICTTSDKSVPVPCKLLVVAFGRIATTFIEAYFINSVETQIAGVVVGGKKEQDLNSVLQTEPSDKTCFIHSSGNAGQGSSVNEVLFCQSKVEYPAGYCHDWAKELLSSIKAEKLLVLSTMPLSLCLTNDEEEVKSDCMFSLKTGTWESSIKYPFMKSPNIISDLPAAVMTHCQVFGIPAAMYVGVTENHDIDSRTLSIFNPLLEEEPLKSLPKQPEQQASEFMKSVRSVSSHLESNLYI